MKNSNKRTIEMKEISKFFPGVRAVDNVDFTLESGCVHAIVGENGAGKSTLMKVLAGVHVKDRGIIEIDGKKVDIKNPSDAKRFGISIIEQEFSLFSELSVFQNIFIGKEYLRKFKFVINWSKIRQKTKEIIKELGLNINISRTIKQLTTSEQQIIEIAKSLFFGSNFIIMDEPTSSLGEEEKEKLFSIIRQLRDKNIGIVYISHRMEEIFDIADVVTVMRDGKKVGTYKISEINEQKIIKLMVGREITKIFHRDRSKAKIGKILLEVKNLSKKDSFNDISFYVREGEVLGLSGLMGSQRTEIVKSIFGLDRLGSGEIFFSGKAINLKNSKDAIKMGMGFVPEDRKIDGIVPALSVKENLSLAALDEISRYGWLINQKETLMAEEQINDLDIKLVSPDQLIIKLSGGNQQKVVLGRCLALKPKLLILDEPTRGIDVGAKAEVHRIIEEITSRGVAIIMISSELPEILGASDRIIVLHLGKITDEYDYKDATQEKIMESALK